MPELPEVKVVIKALKQKILNKSIKNIEIYKEKLLKELNVHQFKKELIGKQIMNITNVGKFIVFELTNELIMISHLRMEGKYKFYLQKTEPEKHSHIVFQFTDNCELHYNDSRMFGTFHLRTKQDYLLTKPLNKIAPVPDLVDVQFLFNKIKKSSVAIKTTILKQELIAGIGNIYADECLFASRIHPLTSCKNITIEQLKSILYNASEIMNKSEILGGSSINSYESLNKKTGEFQNFLQVHTRVNKPCYECQTNIKKIKVNGRGTYYCPRCQGESNGQ
ncbi:DNA-formamidopyrimidine glycosylase [Mycoplasma phocoenae]|uniref:DNA-formamidopyrimidine glycosylase n=1 Tax=Mycoplasma phocoenae TaxID=754517 RepID=A0A858U452_9MOLU|nr:DNA-formamidopyrimidine glycosylase [Mycoplasma phocoenae]QJG66801.1 DNA-formamidopyrimidine glycosylase [Mycoplasma phocoenae]